MNLVCACVCGTCACVCVCLCIQVCASSHCGHSNGDFRKTTESAALIELSDRGDRVHVFFYGTLSVHFSDLFAFYRHAM